MRRCCECRNGEHENLDDDVRMTIVKDPDTGHIVKRGYICGEHREAYECDGYDLIVKGR